MWLRTTRLEVRLLWRAQSAKNVASKWEVVVGSNPTGGTKANEKMQMKYPQNSPQKRFWISGLLLFFFLISINCILVNPHNFIFSDGEDLLLFVFAVFSIILLALFLPISLSKITKRREQGNFKWGWFIGINLLWVIILYFALVGLAIILTWVLITFFGAQNEAGILVLIVILFGGLALPAVIVFTLVPALIYSKLYTRKKILKGIFWTFLLIDFLLIAFYLSSALTCGFYNDHACLAQKAIKTQNPALCAKARGEWAKSACYGQVARTSQDISLCQRITWPYIHYQCTYTVAANNQDPALCEELKYEDKKEGYTKENCYQQTETELKIFCAQDSDCALKYVPEKIGGESEHERCQASCYRKDLPIEECIPTKSPTPQTCICQNFRCRENF